LAVIASITELDGVAATVVSEVDETWVLKIVVPDVSVDIKALEQEGSMNINNMASKYTNLYLIFIS
jgi:hypothetical protein